MSELPSGWGRAEIGDLCNLINGRAFKPQEWSESGLPIIRIQNLNNPTSKFNHFSGEFDAKHHVKNGDLLFAWSGTPGTSFGAHIWHGGDAVLNQHIFKIEFSERETNRGFLRYAINQKLDELISSAQGGVGLRHVTKGTFEKTEISFPPLAEQTRIAQKLDELLAQVDTLKSRIDTIPALLKRFRQSVLAAAVSGRLTEEWRAGNTRCDVAEQINAILRDRLLLSKSKKAPSTHLKNEEYEIPQTWRWVSLDSLSAKIVDGTHHTPTYVESGVPFISVKDIRDGVIDFSSTKFITNREHEELCKRCYPQKGDLLITKSGTIGRTAMVNTQAEFSLFVSVALIKPASKLVNMRFIDIALMKWVGEIDISSRIVGSAIKNLHLTDMKVLAIPFAPLEEQAEIVRRVEQLFAFADQLEAKVATAKARIDRLTQSILAKAFRGELVPQDSNDEPASLLLERIQAQRAAAPKAKRGRKSA
ncbi:type I restriction endonuclease subunit S [Aquipseudomonas alcaligenes]|uniref:Type I restriction endonuclease subunit S n=1 Tax=Aquipseudomonas alcaligenes TaxID=43263 RepID=A0A2V4KPZ7_AQUAC|nr:restriction endonuclease subunit S [Pseudomonas alcaligenes]PYC19994.1 type I restriction endonuclease subunit S [Pseudomonas alcaligenes]